MEDWGRLDIDAALGEVSGRFGAVPQFLVGHSCGGQLFGLGPRSEKLSGVIFVSAQLANWRLWPFPASIGMLFLWHILVPILCAGRRVFPARRIGLSSVDVPSGVVAQWARWARQPDYLFAERFNLDSHRYTGFRFPILAYFFDDDTYAPRKAVTALLSKLPEAAIETVRVQASQLGVGKIGHFGFFKEKLDASLWAQTVSWLDREASDR